MKNPTTEHLEAAKRLHYATVHGAIIHHEDVVRLLSLFPRELFYPLPDEPGTTIRASVNGQTELYVRGPEHWYAVDDLGTEDQQAWTGAEFDSWENF